MKTSLVGIVHVDCIFLGLCIPALQDWMADDLHILVGPLTASLLSTLDHLCESWATNRMLTKIFLCVYPPVRVIVQTGR